MSFLNSSTGDIREVALKRTITVSLYAILVGVIAGGGSVLFRYLIAFFHNLFFQGQFSFSLASTSDSLATWGWLIIFVPVIGMLLVNFLTLTFAPEAKGHGVPEVMHAILRNGGKIRPAVSLVKALASAICIGSGGSVGREGPIVQIGASFGSTIGQFFKLRPREIITLVCAGVAGGIAATFNAPIGGVAFAIELMLPEFSILRLMPLVVSATFATYVSSIFMGTQPAFTLPSYTLVSPYEFIFYIILGFAAGFVSILYIKVLYGLEDYFDRLKINVYLKGFIASLLLGVAGFLVFKTIGHFYIFGVGYDFISAALDNTGEMFWVILALLILKILANALTLAGGGSGGIFAPSLFIGIALGSLVGITVNYFFPAITAPVSAYALVGMAAVVSGTTGASLTAIVMTFEMTRNYEIMLPLMLSVVVASFVTRYFYTDTVYTKKLSRRGESVQLDKLISIFKLTSVREVMNENVLFAKPNMKVEDVLSIMVFHDLSHIPVIEDGQSLGIIGYRDLYSANSDTIIEPYINRIDIVVKLTDDTVVALKKMEENKLGLVLVKNEDEFVGIATRKSIMEKYFIKRELMIG